MTALTRYDPYGGARPSTTLPDGIGYTGEWADATGLVNLRARAYDPSLGAFLSRDAFGGLSTMPLTGNRHAYASGNPLRFTDPSGHFISVGQDFLSFAWLSQDPVALITPAIEDGPGIGGMVEGGLDVAGFVPGIGDAIDLGRAAFDFARYLATGDRGALVQAATGAAAAIPFVGSLGREGARHADEVADIAGMGARRGDDALDAADLGARRGGARLDTGGSPVGPACSFDGATGVLMADGSTRPISGVEVGDRVVAVDPATGERTIETVTAVWAHQDELVVLRVEGGSIVTTEDHPYWDTIDGRWEEAQQLERGDLLRAADGSRIRVLGLVRDSARDGLAWNLTVTGPHTYHVLAGDAALLVHNCALKADVNGMRPASESPLGAGRRGAYREAKRRAGVPVYRQPTMVIPNPRDPTGSKIYRFDYYNATEGRVDYIDIRHDYKGHWYGERDPQNRGPHFNIQDGDHFDY